MYLLARLAAVPLVARLLGGTRLLTHARHERDILLKVLLYYQLAIVLSQILLAEHMLRLVMNLLGTRLVLLPEGIVVVVGLLLQH